MTLRLYSAFHLNLAFSSIEEEQRPEVIRRCYRPLLRLVEELEIPVGIESTGYTLEAIAALDPGWIKQLKELCAKGLVEFIGSGYVQLIGPLVPAAVNHANQRLGLQIYDSILGQRPRLALINEQSYSAGLVPIYRQAGYQAIIMEWDNPASCHPEWNSEWRYHPQYACGPDGTEIPLIWNKSIPFQKFQRYAHCEMEIQEYLAFLTSRIGGTNRNFSMYGNDAEIFDFRPGRLPTEAALGRDSEWDRISCLYQKIKADNRFILIHPGDVLDSLREDEAAAGHHLHLESAAQPVPVKKQAKYNIMRWALSGRDDFGLNSTCWSIYKNLADSHSTTEADWRELCYLWSSDFRTHITTARWQALRERLDKFKRRQSVSKVPSVPHPPAVFSAFDPHDVFTIKQERGFLIIDTPVQRLRLNLRKGMTVDAWWDKTISPQPLVGTLPHGYFDDIHYGADFYTGHFVLEVPGQYKVTDLCPVNPVWQFEEECLRVRADIQTDLGPIHKEIIIEGTTASFEQVNHFHWPACPNGTLRLGHITLKPEAFERRSLFYQTHNGGDTIESFRLNNERIDHLRPVSALVSASHGLGITEGKVELGDDKRVITIAIDKTAAVTGHIVYAPVDGRYFFRLIFSAMEMDDTACQVQVRDALADRIIRWRLTSRKAS